MFAKSAKYYDLIKSSKNYKEESNQIIDILNRFGILNGNILDLACGTGEHDKYLKHRFHVDGLDINEEFIKIARLKNHECTYHLGDMTDFDLVKSYDAIFCLYGSIGYTKSLDNLSKMFSSCKKNLREGGLLVIEPWYNSSNWKAGVVHTTNFESKSVSITRMAIGDSDGKITFHYLIGENEKGVEYFTEIYDFGLFAHKDLMRIFHENGFDTIFISDTVQKRGLYVGKSLQI